MLLGATNSPTIPETPIPLTQTKSAVFLSPEYVPTTHVQVRTLSEGTRKKLKKKNETKTKVNDRKSIKSSENAPRRLDFASNLPCDEHSESSEEWEVSFDATTIGNTCIVTEASSSNTIGLEYRFSITTSTVSSIALSPNGQFLVVGFVNGTIYLYPLTKDSLRFRNGLLLDHISARGMYTQLMVRVTIPDDGKFIFAGVYRGSTEIRAIEVDSIKLPSTNDPFKTLSTSSHRSILDNDHSDTEDEEMGVPTVQSISHSYSDPKLKGFSAVKSIKSKHSNETEYHLLCGLGIKNIHMWRFYRDHITNEWSWECIFDKNSNGISVEMLCFHHDRSNTSRYQFISKAEHQNIRIWDLVTDSTTSMLHKKSHVDVKQTSDATVVYGDYAYGGGESLALIDLRTASRIELDLPLSAKEQQAKEKNESQQLLSTRTRITASMRGRRSRNGGDRESQRLMRSVSQVAGTDLAPFVVGMCTDGSVFMHHPQPETTGLATPLEFIEGYELFFQDPSLSFQAQFSDLTRINASGLLAVVPLPETEKEKWMVVAANANSLLVRSLKSFLYKNQVDQDYDIVNMQMSKENLSDLESDLESSDGESEVPQSAIVMNTQHLVPKGKGKVEPASKPPLRRPPKQITELGNEPVNVKSGGVVKSQKKNKEKVSTPAQAPIETENDSAEEPKDNNDVLSISNTRNEMIERLPTSPQREAIAIEPSGVSDIIVLTPTITTTPTRPSRVSRVPVPSPVVSSPSSDSSPARAIRFPSNEKRARANKTLDWSEIEPPKATYDTSCDPSTTELNSEIVARFPVVAKRGRPPKKKQVKKGVQGSRDIDMDKDNIASLKRPASLDVIMPNKKSAPLKDSLPIIEEVEDECTEAEIEEDKEDTTWIYQPLLSDGALLLSAGLYQYQELVDNDVVRDTSDFTVPEINLLLNFARQVERLKVSYHTERERLTQQFTNKQCDCDMIKKKSSKLDWRKQMTYEVTKLKHMKRRQKKQLVLQLKQHRQVYDAKLKDLRMIQKLELQAFLARQEFDSL